MRLLIVGPKWVAQWTESIGRAAKKLGHTSRLFYYDAYSLERFERHAVRFPSPWHPVTKSLGYWFGSTWERWMNRQLLVVARTFRPELIILLKAEIITDQTLSALRTGAIPIVTWWVDDPVRFPAVIRRLNRFDAVYMFDKARWDMLRQAGARQIFYLPCAGDETLFYPQKLDPTHYPALRCDVGLVAAYYPGRGQLIEHFGGLDLAIWGPGWEAAPELKHLPVGTWRRQLIEPQAVARVYNLAQICPNVHHPQTQVGGLNIRTFEVLLAGGFELVDNVAGIEECFDVGRELIVYTSPAHCRELANYYLAHPSERAAIAERGRARVLRDHTYTHRLQQMLKTLSL